MPFAKLTFRPGLNTQLSKTGNEGGWSDGQFVRFRDGLPEKWMGWQPWAPVRLLGTPRAAHAWQQLDSNIDVAFGTNLRLQLVQGGALSDITPLRRTVTPAVGPFTTTADSPVVVVTDAGHGASLGDEVFISGGTAVGGLTLSGYYTVALVVDASHWALVAGSSASGTAAGGGSPTIGYLLSAGMTDALPSNGWGVGGWGSGTWGTPRTVNSPFLTRQWSLANFGENLLAVPRGDALYMWQPAAGTGARAARVTNPVPGNGPPLVSTAMLIGMPERHVVLLGCSALGSAVGQDPMLVRWSTLEDATTFAATVTNSAGSYRLEGGTRLVCGLNVPNQTLLWSDNCLFHMRFVGMPYVYAFDKLGANGCGIVGPHAAVEYGGIVYWMSRTGVWAFSGGAPRPVPCAVWAHVFKHLNPSQAEKTYCGVNSANGEVRWFYASTDATEIDSYVTLNTRDGSWDFGPLGRTTWLENDVLSGPIATDAGGAIWQHETGHDGCVSTVAGSQPAPLVVSLTSGFVDIGDGTQFQMVNRIIPDMTEQTGNVYMTVLTTDAPNSAPKAHGPFTITPTTTVIACRARGRQIGFQFTAPDLGSHFRLGAVRVNITPDGSR